MAKHVFGFPLGTDHDKAWVEAQAKVEATGNEILGIELVESDAHKANNEFAIVVRTKE